ncbi:MAG: glycosyltransferase family 2 protein [Pseudomonadota bacterium]
MPQMLSPRVDVLLATFNGETYLADLLESILAQTYPDWYLLIHDDGSSDGTINIVDHYQRSHKNRISHVEDEDTCLGACQNFNKLLEHSTADYVMFCDQDDIWMVNKIEIMLDTLCKFERRYGKQTPLLLHSDLIVTDANMNILSNSFWQYQYLQPETGSRFSRLLMQNVVTGSATIINRCAKEHALPIPKGAIMHDWWLALVVAAFGKVRHLAIPTIYYRQHDKNVISAKKWDYKFIIEKVTEELFLSELRESVSHCERQAKFFLKNYAKQLDPKQVNDVTAMAHLSRVGPIARRRAIWQHRLFKMGFIRNAALLLLI